MTLATLIVDLQEDFFVHERLSQRRADLVNSVNELAAMTRETGAPVVWVRQEFSADLSDASLEVKREGIRVVIAGTPGADLLAELDARASDFVVIKKRYSAFFGTRLDDLLAESGTTRLIVAGVNSHACVRATVVDAYQRDYDVVLAQDCIDSHDLEHHEVTWRYMEGKLGRGMDNRQIRSMLAGST